MGGVSQKDSSEPASYWYDASDSAVALLAALRRFRSADHEMRRRTSTGMAVNSTDLAALRILIAHERTSDPATPHLMSEQLGISTASTTKLLHRLIASGHLRRAPHPHDRRSVIVLPTAHAHQQVREHLTRMHDQMLAIAREVPEESREAVVSFLLSMANHLETEAQHEPASPGDDGRVGPVG